MEALAMLKQWRSRRVSTTRIDSNSSTVEDDDKDDEEENKAKEERFSLSTSEEDEGPFFDLEFEIPEEDEGGESKCGREEEEEEKDFIFPVSTGDDNADLSLQLSPSDDLFFKGRLAVRPLTNDVEVQVHSSSSSSSSSSPVSTDMMTKPLLLPISFLKSATATRLRVLVSGLKKPKSTNTDNEDKRQRNPKRQFLTVKFKVDDLRAPIVSLFSREATTRRTGTKPPSKKTDTAEADCPETPSTVEKEEEKRFAGELVQKYLEKIRPLYTKVYKKVGENTPPPTSRPSVEAIVAEDESSSTTSETVESESLTPPGDTVDEGSTSTSTPTPTPTLPPVVGKRTQKLAQVASHLPSGLKVAVKNLVKNNSKLSFSPPVVSPTSVLVRRRDDSLVQQQDGIQSAIAHCKRSLRVSDLENPTRMTSADITVVGIKRGNRADPTIDT